MVARETGQSIKPPAFYWQFYRPSIVFPPCEQRHSFYIMPFNFKIFLLLLFLLPALKAHTQTKRAGSLSAAAVERLHASEDTLALLAYAVVNDSVEQVRFGACRSLIQGLVRALKTENSFSYHFDRLKSISILAPPDSSFRIFTWQLFVNDSTYRYYGAIQMNRSNLVLHALRDRSLEAGPSIAFEQLTPENWYGALYYNLRPFKTKEGTQYLLMGFNGMAFFEKRKVVDVLRFDSDGKPIFGSPVFAREEPLPAGPEQRLIFEYSAEATVRVNWDEQYEMVLFDHLIQMPSPFGRGITAVPDGSYDGLKWEKGKWTFVNKVFNDVMAEPPRPEPVLDRKQESGRDVNGNQVRKKKGRERP